MATRDLARLGARVRTHRLQMYSSRKAAAEAGGITKDTWQRVESGLTAREASYVGVERALGWSVGSCVAIAEGGEPALVDVTDRPALAAVSKPSAEVLRKAVFEAARAKLTVASIGDVDAFAEELVDVLRRAGEVADEG